MQKSRHKRKPAYNMHTSWVSASIYLSKHRQVRSGNQRFSFRSIATTQLAMPLSEVKLSVRNLGRKLPDPALDRETNCTLAYVAEAKRTQQPMPNLTLSANKNEREHMESVLERSNLTVKIAGSEVPVIDLSKGPFLQKIQRACPAYLHYEHPVQMLSRLEFSKVEVGEAARESGRSVSTSSARSGASGGSSSCGSDGELDEELLQGLEEELWKEHVQPDVQEQEMPLQKPCQSAPTMAGGMVLVTILRENGVEVLHRPPLVAQVSARARSVGARSGPWMPRRQPVPQSALLPTHSTWRSQPSSSPCSSRARAAVTASSSRSRPCCVRCAPAAVTRPRRRSSGWLPRRVQAR